MEVRQRVREVVIESGWGLVKIVAVPDRPGIASTIFGSIADAGISVDMILQNASIARTTDVSFTVAQNEVTRAGEALKHICDAIGASEVQTMDDLTKLQLVGTGILTDPSYVGQLFRALAEVKVNVLAIGTSEIRISCLIRQAEAPRARDALTKVFQVGAA